MCSQSLSHDPILRAEIEYDMKSFQDGAPEDDFAEMETSEALVIDDRIEQHLMWAYEELDSVTPKHKRKGSQARTANNAEEKQSGVTPTVAASPTRMSATDAGPQTPRSVKRMGEMKTPSKVAVNTPSLAPKSMLQTMAEIARSTKKASITPSTSSTTAFCPPTIKKIATPGHGDTAARAYAQRTPNDLLKALGSALRVGQDEDVDNAFKGIEELDDTGVRQVVEVASRRLR